MAKKRGTAGPASGASRSRRRNGQTLNPRSR